MKNILKTLILISLVTALSACGGNSTTGVRESSSPEDSSLRTVSASLTESDMESFLQSLDEIAELERAGSWLQGMALTESSIREHIGDYSGSVAAAYKELALAYGRGLIQKQDVEQGLLNLLELNTDQKVADAANAILAFSRASSRDQWEQAANRLSALFDSEEEPDSFINWMLLVCALEKDPQDRRASSAYRSIRARYSQYPEYWYRGARAFSGTAAAEYAENCINASPEGPFADESRKILAEFTGLNREDGLSIRTKREIEVIVSQSVNSGDPQMLNSLLPLIGLPDNPYTVYAIGALRVLTSAPKFREYFSAQAQASRGRLAERLSYISRS